LFIATIYKKWNPPAVLTGCAAGVVIFNEGNAHLLAIFLTAKIHLVFKITMGK
jgi:hypothetical protein